MTRLPLPLLPLLLLSLLPATAAMGSPPRPADARRLAHSRSLWATVNVCGPADRPHALGVRGSMPGGNRRGERMYMRFSVQYRSPRTARWHHTQSASRWIDVGPAASVARESGYEFVFRPSAAGYLLRGTVDFQWRRGRHAAVTLRLHTSAGHRSQAGADPVGYSAATCTLH